MSAYTVFHRNQKSTSGFDGGGYWCIKMFVEETTAIWRIVNMFVESSTAIWPIESGPKWDVNQQVARCHGLPLYISQIHSWFRWHRVVQPPYVHNHPPSNREALLCRKWGRRSRQISVTGWRRRTGTPILLRSPGVCFQTTIRTKPYSVLDLSGVGVNLSGASQPLKFVLV